MTLTELIEDLETAMEQATPGEWKAAPKSDGWGCVDVWKDEKIVDSPISTTRLGDAEAIAIRHNAEFDVLRELREAQRHRSKWQKYEQEYILPCFKWAEEMDINLRQLVHQFPGRNCVELFVTALRNRIQDMETTP